MFSVISRTFVGWVLSLFRNAVGIFYSSSRLGQTKQKHWPHWSKWKLFGKWPLRSPPSELWLFPLWVNEGQSLSIFLNQNTEWSARTHHWNSILDHHESQDLARVPHQYSLSGAYDCDITWNFMRSCSCTYQCVRIFHKSYILYVFALNIYIILKLFERIEHSGSR